MTPPKNTIEVRTMIRILNYYKDMWSRRSHLLHLLTALTSTKVMFKWDNMENKVFGYIKHSVAHYTLLAFLGFNKIYDIQMDSGPCLAASATSTNILLALVTGNAAV